MRETSKESNSMSNLMFAPMSVRLAAQGERDRQELAERRERERIEREAQRRAKSRENRMRPSVPKSFWPLLRQRLQTTDDRAGGPNGQATQKAERDEEVEAMVDCRTIATIFRLRMRPDRELQRRST